MIIPEAATVKEITRQLPSPVGKRDVAFYDGRPKETRETGFGDQKAEGGKQKGRDGESPTMNEDKGQRSKGAEVQGRQGDKAR